jgi:hypothetical protein
MEHVSQREADDGVAAALATVGNWMFSPATRRKIMASSGLDLSLGDYTLLADWDAAEVEQLAASLGALSEAIKKGP